MRQDGFNLTCSVFDTFTKITGSRENYLDLQHRTHVIFKTVSFRLNSVLDSIMHDYIHPSPAPTLQYYLEQSPSRQKGVEFDPVPSASSGRICEN